ncbi:MAG TPA: non-homologous end-joining DNA ligase [Candidatus Acidoferrales bacterium]|nr:non-homologous end-joining DNA ligase [Candidatus Acidoferrales bacterium]
METIPFRVSPMLATLVDEPFSKPDWVFEEKYDGVRILAYKEGDKVSLISRNAIDRSERYPAIAAEIAKLKPPTLLLDGEVVIFDAKKVSRFQLLQQSRGRPQYVVFDCLYESGRDLRDEPLSARRETLERVMQPSPPLVLAERLATDGVKAFNIATRRKLEGVIAKNAASRYLEGRSTEWLKFKVHQEDEFVIGGFTEPAGARHYFGALLLGVYSGDQLRYVGKVGSGFDENTLHSLHDKFARIVLPRSPFAAPLSERGATFVDPKLVAQISFTEWTKDGKLRHPVYLGLRDDKDPKEVVGKA